VSKAHVESPPSVPDEILKYVRTGAAVRVRLIAGQSLSRGRESVDSRVQGGFESVGAALGLGKEKSALHGGEQCKGKPARG
jgi:hypothetical protein